MKILRCFLVGLLTTSLAAHAVSLDLSSFLGGDDVDIVNGVAARGGDVYAVGTTSSTDFPGADTAAEPDGAVFVSRFSGDGRDIVFTTILDGKRSDLGTSIAVDNSFAAYVTGQTLSRDFPLRAAFEPNFDNGAGLTGQLLGAADAFVTKLNGSGAIEFSTYLGGRFVESGLAIAVDRDHRRPYVAGFTSSNNFPLKNEFQGAGGLFTSANAFLTVFAADGQSLVYSTQLGGSAFDSAQALAVDRRTGNAYLAGRTESRTFPLRGPIQASLLGDRDAWVARINPFSPGFSSLVYSTYLGGAGSDEAFGIEVDAAGQAHVTGSTESSDFPLAAPLASTIAGEDAFVTKLNAHGNGLLFSTYLGGSGADRGSSINVDGAGAAYVAGVTSSTDFPVVNAFQSTFQDGGTDGFVAKVDPVGFALLWSSFIGGRDADQAKAISLDFRGDVYVGGGTVSGDTFPQVAAFQNDFGGGESDGFVARLEATPTDTIGLFHGGQFFLRDSNTPGPADFFPVLGQEGDLPVAGRWQGFREHPGVFRDGTFILKLVSNEGFCCNLPFTFGAAGDRPVAGDWDGDGIDTIGVFRPSTLQWFLRNSNSAGPADVPIFLLGATGDLPVAGDWDGDGVDTIGVFRPSAGNFNLRNTNSAGFADIIVIGFGQPGDLPVVGDWDGDGIETIGVFRPATGEVLLRNSNSAGPPDLVFTPEFPGELPVAGDWDNQP